MEIRIFSAYLSFNKKNRVLGVTWLLHIGNMKLFFGINGIYFIVLLYIFISNKPMFRATYPVSRDSRNLKSET